MKLKNITTSDFSFEGVNIPAGGVSEELTPEIAGRLLALNYNRVLIPAEDVEQAVPSTPEGVVPLAEPIEEIAPGVVPEVQAEPVVEINDEVAAPEVVTE